MAKKESLSEKLFAEAKRQRGTMDIGIKTNLEAEQDGTSRFQRLAQQANAARAAGTNANLPGFGSRIIANPSQQHLRARSGEIAPQKGRLTEKASASDFTSPEYLAEKERLRKEAESEFLHNTSDWGQTLARNFAVNPDAPMLAGLTNYLQLLRQSPEGVKYEQFTAKEQEAERQKKAQDIQSWAAKNGFLASAGSLATSPLSGMDYLLNLMETATVGQSLPSNQPGVTEVTQALRSGASQNMGKVGQFIYHTGMSAADSVIAGLLGGGSAGGGIILGLGAASNTANDIKQRGGTDAQALIGGAVSGIFEGLFEKLSLGELEALKELPSMKVKDILKNTAKSVLVNASEEAATEISNAVFDTVFMGNISNFRQMVNQYIAANPGASYEDAKKYATGQIAAQIGESALSGALMGVVFGALGSGSSYRNNQKTGNMIAKAGAQQELLSQAMTFPVSSDTYSMASQLNRKGGEITRGEAGALYRTMLTDIESGIKLEPQSASVSDSAAGGIQTQEQAEKSDTGAGAGKTAAETEQQKVLDAFVRAVQENNRQQAEAAKPKDDLTPQQRDIFDIFFGKNKKAVSEVDTGEKTQGADSAALRKQINDSYASGELTEAEYDDALDALMEQESLEGINTLNRYNPEMMKQEVNDNGRSSISDGSGERLESASAGEQTGQLAEGTGRNQSRTVQSQRAGDRADRVLRVYQSEGRQPVTARSYLGSEKVEDAGQIYEVPQSVIDGDTELSEIAADIRSRGMMPHLFTGEARLANGAVADAMIRGNDVYIRVDSPEWTATQNWEHEKFHGINGKSREMLEDLFVRMTEKVTPEKLRQTIRRYREAYRGIVDVDTNGNPITGDQLIYNVIEEILADAYAGKDTYSQNVEQFGEISQDAANQIEESGGEIRGPPERVFSANQDVQKKTTQKGGNGSLYTYDYLTSKPDLKITEVPVMKIPTKGKKLDTSAIAEDGRKGSGLLYDDTSLGKQRYVYIADIDANVLLSKRGLVHGIIGNKTNSGTQNTAAITYRLPEILRNSVAINEENPRTGADGDFSYVLFGYARKTDGQEYIVKTTVNHFADNKSIVDSVEIYDVLKGSKAKKVGTEVMSSHTGEPAALLSNASVPTTISVADILRIVKENYPELLPDSVRAALKMEGYPKQDNLRFSTSEASATDTERDPVQALPKKAQWYLESKEWTLTNSLGDALRIPFKNRGEQLQGIAREITTEFLQTGDVSEKTLDDLFERAYRPNERKLAEKMGIGVEEYREQIERDFKAQAGDLVAQLRLANRYAADQVADGKGGEKPVPTLEHLPKLYDDMKAARRAADKAVARNLLTESDNAKVNRLLRGDIDESMLNPLTDNVQGILEVFHAKEEYEKFAKEIRGWNAKRKEDLRALADKLLETAGEWKDKAAGILYSRETMERNIRDIVKDKKVADEVINTLFKPVHDAAAKATKMKNEYRDRVRALDLSRKVEKGNKISEAAAVQLLGEAEDNIRYLQKNKFMKERDGKTLEDWNGIVRDLWENNPNLDAAKIRNAVNEFREIYDELFEQMNDARMRNGYEPINYRKGYFPHFRSDSGDGILAQFGSSLGINTAALQLPTTINGMTHTFKPGIQWFGSAQQRKGSETSFDAVEGFDSYIEGVADVIHQTDNIQRLRAFATQVRYRTSDEGLRKQVDRIRNDARLTDEEKQNEIAKKWEEGKFELGNFAVELDEYTNLLAGKKSRHDRDMEQKLGRRSYAIMKAMESRVAANMVAINPGSWLTNFIPITQGAATLDSRSLLVGMWDTLRAIKQDDGMVARSSFLTNRRGSDPLVRTWAQETSAKMSALMELIDSFTADTLVRARYNQNIRVREMSEEAAIADADAWAAGVMADRSKGAMPTLFSQTNPFTKLLTQFQLEVNNQLSFVFKDIPREMKEKGVAALTLALLKFMIGAYFYNELYEKFLGRRPALDPLGIINDTVGDLTGYEMGNLLEDGVKVVEVEKKGLYDAGLSLGKAVAEELPFVGGLLGGGRLPINSALPDFGKLWQAATDSDWDAKKRVTTAAKELAKPAVYILPPFGGGQVKKIAEGAEAVIRGGSYGVDSKGADILQYPMYTDTFGEAGWNAAAAMLFGKSSLGPAREWVESGFNSLSAKETALFDSLRNNGANSRDAYDLIRDLQELETKLEKITEIATAPFAEMLKEAAMSNQMSFSQYEKYMAARKAGLSTEQYAELLNKLDAEARRQKVERQEGKPTTSQIESEMWSDNLTPDERRALWDSSYNLSGEYEAMLEKYANETEIGAGSVSKKVLEAVLKEMKLTKQQKDAIRESYGW